MASAQSSTKGMENFRQIWRRGVRGAWMPVKMYSQNGLSSFCYSLGNQLGIHLPCINARIDKDRVSACIADRIHRGDVGEGRDNDLVSGAYTKGEQGCVQSGGAI